MNSGPAHSRGWPASHETALHPRLSNWPGQAFSWSEARRSQEDPAMGQHPGGRAGRRFLALAALWGFEQAQAGQGYLGKWSPEVFLAPPLRNRHISTLLRPQALLTLMSPPLPATTKSSGQRHFCKLIAKGQAETPRNYRGLTGVRIQFPLIHPANHWISKYSLSSIPTDSALWIQPPLKLFFKKLCCC